MSTDRTAKTPKDTVRPAGAPTPVQPASSGAGGTPPDPGKAGGAAAAPAGGAAAAPAGAASTTAVKDRPAAAQDSAAPKPLTTGPPRPAARVAAMARVPGFAPLSPVVGWMAAWGTAAVAVSCLLVAGVDLGMGLGLVEGAYGVDGVMPGLYLAAVQAGAFLLGGYAAARYARGNGMLHAVLAWALAMIATGADTIVADMTNGDSVLEPLFIPFWIDNGMGAGFETALALGAFAVAALVGALVGGALGAAANRAATRKVTLAPGSGELPRENPTA